jgi:two-component system CheB/CheR fusion protein
LRTAIEYPIVHDGAVTTLSATFGVACAPADADSAQSLLQRADEAMYVGKAQGGRLITAFQPQMHMQARSNAQRRHDLAQAISNGELTVWFQPIHDAFTGSVWGCEALVRWRRDGAVIPAKEFVPFAQMSGQIRQIGLFTVSSVQQAVMQLPSHVRDWSWTVNVSASELSSPEMVSRLKSLLDAAPDSRIVLEVTEETALNEGSAAESALIALHNSGALLAIDDFGSGFSNFAVLERLQPEIVKIDQALVIKAVEDNTRAQTFVAASIAIAHSLGAHVVAEGVEDERIRASLVRMGVDLLQGHYIGRPAPLDEVLPRADAPVLEHP